MVTRRRLAAAAAAAMMIGSLLATAAPATGQTTATCNGLAATIVGTDGNDRIEGTPAPDVIVGLAGKDIIFGREGNDVICGGTGNDVIKGGAGRDHMEGNEGNDKLVGGIGKDTMLGGQAKDKLFGGGGGDIMVGGGKRDFLNGQNGNDECDLDRTDRFTSCETGDVVGVSGTSEGTFSVSIPDELVAYNIGADGGPSLQPLTPVVVVQFATNRTGPGTTTLTFFDEQGVILNQFGSVNGQFVGISAVWGLPASFSISTGGAPVSFDLAFVPHDLLFRGGRNIAGQSNLVYVPEFPTDGPLDFQFMIGEDVTGSVAVFFYDANGNLTSPVFIPAVRPDTPREYAMAVQAPIRIVEVFATGSWTLRLSEPAA